MHDESWKDYPDKRDFPSTEQWKNIHEVLSFNTIEEMSTVIVYEYFRKYCYLPDSGFCFNAHYVYFNGIPRYIDKVHSEESFFQQSTIHDYYDLSYTEIMNLKKIYEFIIGDFP